MFWGLPPRLCKVPSVSFIMLSRAAVRSTEGLNQGYLCSSMVDAEIWFLSSMDGRLSWREVREANCNLNTHSWTGFKRRLRAQRGTKPSNAKSQCKKKTTKLSPPKAPILKPVPHLNPNPTSFPPSYSFYMRGKTVSTKVPSAQVPALSALRLST